MASPVGGGLSASTRGGTGGSFLLPDLPPGDYSVDIFTRDGNARHISSLTVTAGLVTVLGEGKALPSLEADPDAALFPALPAQASQDPDSDAEGEALPAIQGLPVTQNASLRDGADPNIAFSGTPIGSGSPVDPTSSDDSPDGISDLAATSRTPGERSLRSAAVPFAFARPALREVNLPGDPYSALYGRGTAVALSASRSGGSAFHGTAFLQLRNRAFNATNPFAIATRYNAGAVTSAAVRPNDVRQQFGGALGGFLVPDRPYFFFAAVDAQRRGYPAISSPQDPSFYTLTAMQRALLLNRGVRTTAIASALTYLDSLTGSVPRRSDGAAAFLRVDAPFVSVQYSRVRWNQPAGALSAPVIARARASIGNSSTAADTVLGRFTIRPVPRLLNEVSLAYTHSLQSQSPQTPLPQEPAIGPSGLPPEVAIGPQGLTFGTPASLGRTAYPEERRLQFTDSVSLILGRRHHLHFGADVSAISTFVAQTTNQQGTFSYDSGLTAGRAGGLVDFITDSTFNVNAYPNGGCPSISAAVHLFCFRSFTQSFGQPSVQWNTQEWAGFLQDDLTLRPRLTLHFGLRYDYQLLPLPQRPNPALDTLFNTGSLPAATSIFPEDRNNFGPRAAMAWQPLSRLTVRAGYGIFYGQLPGATIRAALVDTDLPAATTHIRITPSTTTACPQVANQGFGYPCAYLASPASALPDSTSATLFARRFRLPAIQQASLALQYRASRRTEFEATYRLNLDRQLPNSVDVNIAPSTTTSLYQLGGGLGVPGVSDGETFSLPLYTARRTATVGPVTAITSAANAMYHGVIVGLHHRARSLTLSATYSFSRVIDFNPLQGAIPRTSSQLDPFDLRFDKGLSSLNFPQHLALHASWQPRLAVSSRALRLAANGWSLSPVFLLRSGAPYSLALSGGPRLSGGHQSLNAAGGELYLPTVGRNTMRLPSSATLDLRLSRAIHLRDHLVMSLSAEAYNLANTVNPSGITNRAFLVGTATAPTGPTPLVFQSAAAIAAEGLNTRAFGTFTDSGTAEARARELQLGLRLAF